ncbi:MAG: OprO/OprP family phosphate-selective porin [Planctomycetota bacterium]|jgi:phosphate-selective porin OprO/OprP
MKVFLTAGAAVTVLLLAAGAADAAEEKAADVSLEKEVARYVQMAEPKADDPTFKGEFKTGPRWTSADGNFQVKFIGRLMVDWFWQGSDDFADTPDGVFVRRARIGTEGTAYKNVIYKLEIDFSKASDGDDEDNEVVLADVFLGLKNLPTVGTLLIGHIKEYFSLEELTSSKYIQFMERSAPVQAFAPARNQGLGLTNTALEQRLVWGAGIFRETDPGGRESRDGGYNLTVRVAGTPINDKEKKMLMHVGFAFSYRDPMQARFRARPGIGTGPRYVNTDKFDVDKYSLFGFEFAYIWKSLSFQAEFILADVDAPASGDPSFSGWYIAVSYWITGESRNYSAYSGAFGRNKPKQNLYDGKGGYGGWEIAYRFDSIDLIDGLIAGGEQVSHTVGVNWHWNPNARVMFNFVYADITDGPEGTGKLQIFETRFQFDW